jgi:chemotaxis signal transduction protein
MSVSEAWLLESNDSLSIAISDSEMIEYVHAPVIFSVPGSPNYCNHVLHWQNNLVPVMDIGLLLSRSAAEASKLMSLVAYQDEPGSPLQYLAIQVRKPPEKIQVDDSQASELSEEISASLLMPLCLSCFTRGDQSVLILDIPRLCSAEFRDQADEIRNSRQNIQSKLN